MDKFTYSKGPIYSMPPFFRFLTGLTNLDGDVAKNIPGKNFSIKFSLLGRFSCFYF